MFIRGTLVVIATSFFMQSQAFAAKPTEFAIKVALKQKASTVTTYEDVEPILASLECVSCHLDTADGIKMTAYPFETADNKENAEVIKTILARMTSKDKDVVMPPPPRRGDHIVATEAQIKVIEAWQKGGLKVQPDDVPVATEVIGKVVVTWKDERQKTNGTVELKFDEKTGLFSGEVPRAKVLLSYAVYGKDGKTKLAEKPEFEIRLGKTFKDFFQVLLPLATAPTPPE